MIPTELKKMGEIEKKSAAYPILRAGLRFLRAGLRASWAVFCSLSLSLSLSKCALRSVAVPRLLWLVAWWWCW